MQFKDLRDHSRDVPSYEVDVSLAGRIMVERMYCFNESEARAYLRSRIEESAPGLRITSMDLSHRDRYSDFSIWEATVGLGGKVQADKPLGKTEVQKLVQDLAKKAGFGQAEVQVREVKKSEGCSPCADMDDKAVASAARRALGEKLPDKKSIGRSSLLKLRRGDKVRVSRSGFVEEAEVVEVDQTDDTILARVESSCKPIYVSFHRVVGLPESLSEAASGKSGTVLGRWEAREVSVETWLDEKNAHVRVVESDTGSVLVEWWDSDIEDAFDEGRFLGDMRASKGDPLRMRFERSVVEHADRIGAPAHGEDVPQLAGSVPSRKFAESLEIGVRNLQSLINEAEKAWMRIYHPGFKRAREAMKDLKETVPFGEKLTRPARKPTTELSAIDAKVLLREVGGIAKGFVRRYKESVLGPAATCRKDVESLLAEVSKRRAAHKAIMYATTPGTKEILDLCVPVVRRFFETTEPAGSSFFGIVGGMRRRLNELLSRAGLAAEKKEYSRTPARDGQTLQTVKEVEHRLSEAKEGLDAMLHGGEEPAALMEQLADEVTALYAELYGEDPVGFVEQDDSGKGKKDKKAALPKVKAMELPWDSDPEIPQDW